MTSTRKRAHGEGLASVFQTREMAGYSSCLVGFQGALASLPIVCHLLQGVAREMR